MRRLLLLFFTTLPSLYGNAQPAAWWFPPNSGLAQAVTRYDDLYFWKKLEGALAAPDGRIMKTYDGGIFWYPKFSHPSQPYFRSIEALDGGEILLAGSLDGITVRSTDSGESWTDIGASIPDTGISGPIICGLAHEGRSFYGVGWWGGNVARFYKSTDAGITWQVDFLDTAKATGLVDIIAAGNGLLLAGGGRRYGAAKQESVVLRSADGGTTWTKVFSDTTLGGRIWKLQAVTSTLMYGAIEPLFNRDSIAIIRSTDGGLSWSIMPVGSLPTWSWGTQGIGFINPARGWVGGYYFGMFETLDSGNTWTYIPMGANLNRFFRYDAGTMYAAGTEPMVFLDSAASASVKTPTGANAEKSHQLHLPSPNPASREISFSFTLTRPTNLLLDVVDIAGRRIIPVRAGRFGKGEHSIRWDCSGLSAGSYAVRMETDEGPVGEVFTIVR